MMKQQQEISVLQLGDHFLCDCLVNPWSIIFWWMHAHADSIPANQTIGNKQLLTALMCECFCVTVSGKSLSASSSDGCI
jgi:hypothetical protein